MKPRADDRAGEGPAIALRDLAKSYGRVHAVRGITFDVARGEIFGFLGLNGAGKTTTIRMLVDLLRPSRGSATLFGIDCQKLSRQARALVGYMPGELGLYSDMTGIELLDLLAHLSGTRVDTAYRLKLVDTLELPHADLRRSLREYSTGMKRKLGLVQALQADPPLLILDEPTEGIQPNLVQQIGDVLIALNRDAGVTLLLVEQQLRFARRVASDFRLLEKGRCVAGGPIDELTDTLVHEHLSV